jgi:3-methyladenine DNA glycosylase AlkC
MLFVFVIALYVFLMEKLSEFFNQDYYLNLSQKIKKIYSKFEEEKFYNEAINDLEKYELMQRLRNTSLLLNKYLTTNYRKDIELLKELVKDEKSHFRNLVFPDYVQLFGIDDEKFSLDALVYFTQFGSSEFAIRHFLKKDLNETLKVMENWSLSENHHVRRLSSEGSRCRLPWSFKLVEIEKNPHLTSKIINHLKEDNELYVKKSAANHLNDFSKKTPEFVLNTLKTWDFSNEHSFWIAKHATRTLIKQGDVETLYLFGFSNQLKIKIEDFKLNKNAIQLGETLTFSFGIQSESDTNQSLVIDYAIHYLKKSGVHSKKVFKLKIENLKANDKIFITKNQVFKDFTTRKHYAGEHFIELLINGNVYKKEAFYLT